MHPTLLLTHRGLRHQQNLLAGAPAELELTLLRDAPRATILSLLPQMEFLISEREEVIDAGLIAAGKNLRLIQRLGAQTWDIDLEAARRAGIAVCCRPDWGTMQVAEHCLMQTLDLMKRARDLCSTLNRADWSQPPRLCDEDTFAYNWTGRAGSDSLWGQTVGILGFGEIGRQLAGLLRGFNPTLLYAKRQRLSPQAEAELGVTYAQPDELIRRAQVVYGLLPFSAEQAQGFNAAFFARMRPGAYFVFCGGSGMVHEGDLIAALQAGQLAGAALDTFTREPLPTDSPLLALHRQLFDPACPLPANLLLTPHVAAGTGSATRHSDYANLLHLLAGRPLEHRVA